MWKVLVDGEIEVKGASFVHTLVRFDRKREVQDVIWVWELRAHGVAEGKL